MCTEHLQTLTCLKLRISTYENIVINSSGWPVTHAHNGNPKWTKWTCKTV